MLTLGGRTFPRGRQLIMAIVNRTPDSFYDKGATYAFDRALERVAQVIEDGGEIVGIGGCEGGAGSRGQRGGGARPDGRLRGRGEDGLPGSAAQCRHLAPRGRRRGVPGGRRPAQRRLGRCRPAAGRAGRRARRSAPSILIDPAHDFGKNTYQSRQLTRDLDRMVATGWPVLVSLSNKDFVGETLGGLPVDQRLVGTLATTAVCAPGRARWSSARTTSSRPVRCWAWWQATGHRPARSAVWPSGSEAAILS